MNNLSRPELRNRMRAQRQRLSEVERLAVAQRVADIAGHSALFLRSRHIAFYLSNDGEVSLAPLMQRAWAMGKICYLPVILSAKRLRFAPYAPGEPLRPNQFGIPEPARTRLHVLDARLLDLVLLPLVAFDTRGNRLGMGGGYYDRSLSFLRLRHHWRKPRLLGIAYECQRVARLEAKSWDVPLDGIATESRLYLAAATSHHDADPRVEPRIPP